MDKALTWFINCWVALVVLANVAAVVGFFVGAATFGTDGSGLWRRIAHSMSQISLWKWRVFRQPLVRCTGGVNGQPDSKSGDHKLVKVRPLSSALRHGVPSFSIQHATGYILPRPSPLLKEKSDLRLTTLALNSRTHSGFIGRHPGPDSPPTTTQDMPSKDKQDIDDSSGSRERNLTDAGICLSESILQ